MAEARPPAEQVVLPTENPAEFKAFIDGWLDDWQPADSAAAELVEQAATAAWRRKRCVRAEAERMTGRIRDAMAEARRAEGQRLDRLVARLADDPYAAVAALRASRAGASRLAAMWRKLAEAAAKPCGWNDFRGHHVRLFNLLGRMPGDDDVRSIFEVSWGLHLANDPEIADPDDHEVRPFDPECHRASRGVAPRVHPLAGGGPRGTRRRAAGRPGGDGPPRRGRGVGLAAGGHAAPALRIAAIREFHLALRRARQARAIRARSRRRARPIPRPSRRESVPKNTIQIHHQK